MTADAAIAQVGHALRVAAAQDAEANARRDTTEPAHARMCRRVSEDARAAYVLLGRPPLSPLPMLDEDAATFEQGGGDGVVSWPRTIHRTARAASPVDRACAVEAHRPRGALARTLVALAVVGAVAMLIRHVIR